MAGVPHRKLTMLGYNAVNGRYEFVTADNLDTQQMVYQGSSDERTGVITMIATYTQAVYAEMIAGDGLSRAAGGPSRIAIGGVEIYTVRQLRNRSAVQNEDPFPFVAAEASGNRAVPRGFGKAKAASSQHEFNASSS